MYISCSFTVSESSCTLLFEINLANVFCCVIGALFNALQSAILAFFSYRVADRLWVKTETLELNHYIEIREEFERVDSILYGDEAQRRVPASEFVFEYNVRGLQKVWERFCRFVRHPIMSQRHADLLVQVRFHDLRVHFLKANDLPLQLMVSDYLKRSLLSVLQQLAHISAVAWLLLTGAIALLYFLMGIVIYVTNDLTKVGVSLTWIYLCSMIFFVLLSLIIYNKMKWIFDRIMRMKLLGQSNVFKSGMSIRKGEKHVQNQSDLFWGGNPNIITVIIQFAQFGFALALSILLVFWDDINVKNVPVASWVYIVTVFACYAAFVAIMAQVIPRFTLCTNLGQLLNKKHIQETLGEFYLQEAERKRQEQLEDQDDDDDYIEMNNADDASALSKDSPDSTTFNPTDSSTRTTTSNTSNQKQERTAKLADLVQSDTESLRFMVDGDQSLRSRNERSMRRKAVSDGVALMRSMSGKPPKPPIQQRSRVERKKSNSSSDVVFQMQNDEVSKPIHKSSSGPSLNTLSPPFEPIDEHKETPVVPRTSHRRSKTLSSGSAPLPPLNETSSEAVEVAVSVDPLVGSMATLSHPRDASAAADDRSTDDIPLDDETHHHDHDEEPTYLIDAMKDYFSGPKYPVVSAVFGTLACFWVVGQRIEELLLATGAMPDLKNTFQFPLKVSFWWETAYLACFILSSSFVALAFGFGRATSNRERTLSLAGFLDVVLASTCLVLLMVAEAQRCYCVEGDNQEDCCPAFGSRTYGGVGSIEPITAIIAFRLLRFWVSKNIIKFLDKFTHWSSKDVPAKKDHHGHGHGHHGHGGDPREMAVDVWKAALALYPETVEEHGEFSTELLQKMLGVEASVNKSVKAEPKVVQEDEVSTVDAFISADEKSASNAGGSYVPKRVRHKQAMEANNTFLNIKETPTLTNLSNVSATFGQKITFVRPNAKILRSMRRCDRKLLPLINTWTAVDIVMTKYELVYFEALDIEDPCKSRYNDSDLEVLEAGRKALNVTSGGKGVRLKDIAKGRKVVGHLAISEIDSVHVDRVLPHADKKHEKSECYFEKHDEFWELNQETYIEKGGLSREARWARVKEDRLMIHSSHGTLCFRFYSDLTDMEDHLDRTLTENERDGKIHKDLALLWCQSIGRVCKRAQLRQTLDHYGESNDEELRDYLRVVDANDHGNDRMRDRIHRRASSAVGMLPRLRRSNSVPSEIEASSPVASKRPSLVRGKTVGGPVGDQNRTAEVSATTEVAEHVA